MSNYGLKASTSTTNAITDNSKIFSFTSEYPMLKILKFGQIDVVLSAGFSSNTYNIRHGLGYAPAFLVTGYGPVGTSAGQRNIADYVNSGAEKILASSNNTDLIIVASSGSSGGWSGTIFYYIFLDVVK